MNRGIVKENANYEGEGILEVPENLVISYINQDTSHLKGFLKDYCELQGLDYTLFLSLLRQLDFERVQFVKPMEQYSEGQKKKVLIAASLLTSAHLYIWDEPLNWNVCLIHLPCKIPRCKGDIFTPYFTPFAYKTMPCYTNICQVSRV